MHVCNRRNKTDATVEMLDNTNNKVYKKFENIYIKLVTLSYSSVAIRGKRDISIITVKEVAALEPIAL